MREKVVDWTSFMTGQPEAELPSLIHLWEGLKQYWQHQPFHVHAKDYQFDWFHDADYVNGICKIQEGIQETLCKIDALNWSVMNNHPFTRELYEIMIEVGIQMREVVIYVILCL